jgi:hypothetical protein
MAITVAQAGSVQISDTVTNNLTLNKTFAALNFVGSVSTFAESVNIGTSPTSIALPVSPTIYVYIKNAHATQTLQVTWTPNGGASNVVVTLQPGEYIVKGAFNNTSGITALTLLGSGVNTTCEYILAG